MKIIQRTLLPLIVSLSLLSEGAFAEAVWIDVRSVVEHKIDHIEGDPRISHNDIVGEVQELFPNKETEIHLYCRSGGRADKARIALEEAGYKNVTNVGSIGAARKLRESKATTGALIKKPSECETRCEYIRVRSTSASCLLRSHTQRVSLLVPA